MKLYIHEIAMHHSHNVDDFRPPYAVEEENEEEPDYITPAHIDSLTICLDSIHKAFDAFISMPVSTLRSLPTLFFVRNSYAAVALIKMYTAVSAKGSKFGSVFKPEELKVEYYLNAVVNTMNQTAQGGASRVASKFTYIVGILRDWQAKRAAGSLTSKDKGMLSFKSISAGWERHQKQNRQDCQTASWNGAGAAVNTNSKNKPQHSGLQMLSEVAMGDNNNNHNPTPPNNNNTMNNTSSDPTSAALAANATTTTTTTAAQTQAQAPWEAQLAAYTDMHPPSHPHQHSHTGNLPAQDPSAAAAAAGFPPPPQQQSYIPSGGGVVGVGDMDGFTLTAEELGALGIGTMLDDPGWLSFGLESGGWAM